MLIASDSDIFGNVEQHALVDLAYVAFSLNLK